jgi:hypothetical protein
MDIFYDQSSLCVFLHSCGYRQEGSMGRKSGMGNSYDFKNY